MQKCNDYNKCLILSYESNHIENICSINKKITELDLDSEIIHGKFRVDGKSLLGCLAIDFSQGVIIESHSTNELNCKLYAFILNLGVEAEIINE